MKKIKKSIDMLCMYVMLLHTYIHTFLYSKKYQGGGNYLVISTFYMEGREEFNNSLSFIGGVCYV